MENIVNKTTGILKENVGYVIGNERMEREGHDQRAQAVGQQQLDQQEQERQQKINEAKNDPNLNRAGGATQEAGGAAKETLGKILGNESMQAEGHNDRVQGKGEQKIYGDKAKQEAEAQRQKQQQQQ
ncbi:hypothetical protein GGI25_001908 [Coemansia spiralis]|uniref:CsbD-like domain-containing protein n=2 Tax=Coemansia TaxID=4863 RepID=A0A9W8GBK7_9FUNG|nr:hypothetical protein BX070DRAFT_252561 [Coemansia spiralis]KAJ1993341.1 hypothetical protein EDC05_002205 [Coemansia umbellata]KAJ2623510.1 hypothetical protein GGI26_002349 [Coemansia sp. RSA 1358]KAJ2678919.1 hypothetical protein GGI25_001908 [Coemansia spiralis]